MDGTSVAIVIGSLACYGVWVGLLMLGAATERRWAPVARRLGAWLFDR